MEELLEKPRLEVHNDDIASIFQNLISMEKRGITLGNIDETGLFTCDMDSVPLLWVKLSPMDLCYGYSKNLYVIPMNGGDILHSIRIYGRFKSAKLYQYSFLDTPIEFDHVEGINNQEDSITILNPFPQSGIPILQTRKNIYLELISMNEDTEETPKCEIGYGYLDNKLRKQFNPTRNQTKGVSFMHKSGQRYAVFGIDAPGHSINVAGPEG